MKGRGGSWRGVGGRRGRTERRGVRGRQRDGEGGSVGGRMRRSVCASRGERDAWVSGGGVKVVGMGGEMAERRRGGELEWGGREGIVEVEGGGEGRGGGELEGDRGDGEGGRREGTERSGVRGRQRGWRGGGRVGLRRSVCVWKQVEER